MIVATIGLHGSASTWVFNVVRELLLTAHGEDTVLSCYADEPAQLPAEAARAGKALVVKSHHGSVALDAWLKTERAPLFLSIRDPRDAAISMAQRFRTPLAHTVRWLSNDCVRMMRLADEGHPLFRYEDRFFDDPATVAAIARALGVAVAPERMETIFARYRTEAVRAFAARLADLPPERVAMVGAIPIDKLTQILAVHIGDLGEGKWDDLPLRAQSDLARAFAPFLARFLYPP